MEGIVLAGVHSWRDDAFERAAVRPALAVASRPLLWHSLDWLHRNGINRARLCGNGETAIIAKSLSPFPIPDMRVVLHEDPIPRGPAGCVRDAAEVSDAEAFVVVEGTVVPRLDLEALLRTHLDSEAALTVAVNASTPTRRSADPAGIYVFSRSALGLIPDHGYQDIKEALIPMLYRRGRQVVTHACRGLASWRVSDATSYLSVNMRVVEEFARATTPPAGFVRHGDALCHESATVDPTATFVGPSLVGARSRIEAGAVIVGPTSFGAACRVGRDAVVTRSAIWDGAVVQSRAYLDGCVLTAGAVVEKGAVVRCAVRSPGRGSRMRNWFTRWLGGAEAERDMTGRA